MMDGNPFVDMSAYEFPGGGVSELVKALTSTQGTDVSQLTGGDALKVQFLDRMLYDTTFADRHVKLFKALKTEPLTSNVAEWVERGDYGAPWGAVSGAGDNPPATTADLARRVGFAKYYRTLRGVDHPTTIIKSIVAATAEEEEAGTKFLIAHIERDLFFGDAGVIPEQFDGLLPLILRNGDASCVIDMHATAYTDQEELHNAAAVVGANGGVPTHFFVDPASMNDVDKIMLANQRLAIPAQLPGGRAMVDMGVAGFRHAWGETLIEPDVFLAPERGWIARKADPLYKAPAVSRGGDASAPVPATPTITSIVGGGDDGNATNFPSGSYGYQVSAINANGESAATALTAAAVTAGEHARLTLTHADATTTGFRIYRTRKDDATGQARFLCHIPADADGTTVWDDTGEWIPGTTCNFLVDISAGDAAVDWMQLLPMMKLPFGIRRPRVEWLQMIYGFLRLTRPWRAVVIKNILPSQIAKGWVPI